MKTDWLEHRLRVNAEAFYYNYTNQQVEIIEGGAFEVNAARSRIYGVDLELTGKPTDALTLFANLNYLNGKYEAFPAAPVYIQLPRPAHRCQRGCLARSSREISNALSTSQEIRPSGRQNSLGLSGSTSPCSGGTWGRWT